MALKAPNRIPEEEWVTRANALREQLTGKERVLAHQATEMFSLYNDKFRPEEWSKHCAKCVGRVWKRICAHLDSK